MPTVRYTVINGEVIAEKRNGVRRLYVPDPLGSTVALVDSTQTITDRFGYWPYGEEASRTGTTPTPFRFVGTRGYHRDRLNSIYVRRRHYRPDEGRWTSADPAGQTRRDPTRYSYAASNPVTEVDPSGLGIMGDIIYWCTPPQSYLFRCYECLQGIYNQLIGPDPLVDSPWWREHVPFLAPLQWDAFRHCHGNCLAVRQCPWGCARLTDMRESGRTRPGCQDRLNNAVGRQIGAGGKDCLQDCLRAVRDGRLVIDPDRDRRCSGKPEV